MENNGMLKLIMENFSGRYPDWSNNTKMFPFPFPPAEAAAAETGDFSKLLYYWLQVAAPFPTVALALLLLLCWGGRWLSKKSRGKAIAKLMKAPLADYDYDHHHHHHDSLC